MTGGGATDVSCCFCFAVLEVSAGSWSLFPSDDGPACAFSTAVIFVLFLRLRFSAASSLILTGLSGTRPPDSEGKLASFSGI